MLGAVLLSLCTFNAKAQAYSHTADTLSLTVHFRRGISSIDQDYRDNRDNIRQFLLSIDAMMTDSTSLIHSVNIETYASPDGPIRFNERLSMDRAHSIRDFLLQNTTLSASQLKIYSGGVNWSGLESLLLSSGCPWSGEVIDIIHNVPQEDRNAAIKAIDNGECWDWIYNNLFEDLRSADGRIRCIVTHQTETRTVVFQKDTVFIVSVREVPTEVSPQPVAPVVETPTPKAVYAREADFRTPAIALRTNLCVPFLNAGLEVPLSNRWSLGADVYYPWLKREWVNMYFTPQRHCFQWIGGMFEIKYWLGRHHSSRSSSKYRLCGHSLGLMYSGGIYDFEFRCQGQQGDYHAVGLEYGYSAPLGKGGVHLDFGLGIGYVYDRCHEYSVYQPGGYLTATSPKHVYQGVLPIRADFSIVVPIFRKSEKQ